MRIPANRNPAWGREGVDMDIISKLRAGCSRVALVLGLVTLAAPAFSDDNVAVEFGTSAKGAHVGRLVFQKTLLDQSESACHCDAAFLEFDISQWKARDSAVGTDYIYEVGVQPVYRLQRGPISASFLVRPFLEIALGVHYLSSIAIPNTDYYTSTQFQFGEHLGWGFTFGKNDAFVLAQRFQHLSNGNIRLPNPGINYQIVHLSYKY